MRPTSALLPTEALLPTKAPQPMKQQMRAIYSPPYQYFLADLDFSNARLSFAFKNFGSIDMIFS